MTSTDRSSEASDKPELGERSSPPKGVETSQRLRIAIAAALDRKAVDLKALYLGAVSDFTDHFLICSGQNERQVQAIADAIEEKLRQAGARPLHIEGYTPARWVLMDYGSLVVHVFQDEIRQFYSLERLWADAPDVTAEHAGEA